MTENMWDFPFLGWDETQVKVVLSPVVANVEKVMSRGGDQVKQNSSQDACSPGLEMSSGDGHGHKESHQAVLVQFCGQRWPCPDFLQPTLTQIMLFPPRCIFEQNKTL